MTMSTTFFFPSLCSKPQSNLLKIFKRSDTRRLILRSRHSVGAMSNSNSHSYATKQPGNVEKPRPSASLVLLDSQNRILLTHRTSTLGSFANAHVFPGGNLDPAQDHSHEECAIRETFEETGILLSTTGIPESLIPSLAEVRKQIHSRTLKFSDFCSTNNLKLDEASLMPFTTWITPPTMKKRYETQMFLSFLPLVGSDVDSSTATLPTPDGGIETVSTEFMPASEILSKSRSHSIILFPPQAYLIARLSYFTSHATLSIQEQRDAIKRWLAGEDMNSYVFEPRPEGKASDGRTILGFGPKGDQRKKALVTFGKGGMPSDVEIVKSRDLSRL